MLVVKSRRGDIFISPGGKYEDNESPLECLSRELAEELKIKVMSVKYYKTYQEKSVFRDEPLLLETYFVQYQNVPQPASEIVTFYWANKEEILGETINVASGLKSLVPDLIRDGYLKNHARID